MAGLPYAYLLTPSNLWARVQFLIGQEVKENQRAYKGTETHESYNNLNEVKAC